MVKKHVPALDHVWSVASHEHGGTHSDMDAESACLSDESSEYKGPTGTEYSTLIFHGCMSSANIGLGAGVELGRETTGKTSVVHWNVVPT